VVANGSISRGWKARFGVVAGHWRGVPAIRRAIRTGSTNSNTSVLSRSAKGTFHPPGRPAGGAMPAIRQEIHKDEFFATTARPRRPSLYRRGWRGTSPFPLSDEPSRCPSCTEENRTSIPTVKQAPGVRPSERGPPTTR
jgi:hypothetical protein